jgi:hypothetical protein
MDRDLIEKAASAKRSVVEGSLEIWNTRLEILRSAGDIRGLLEVLKDPVEPYADNGNCGGCNCGAEQLGTDLSLAGPATPKK